MESKQNKKLCVLLLFGGRSAEHEVSVRSAFNVARAVDSTKYDLLLVGIDRNGRWVLVDGRSFFDMHRVVPYTEKDEVILPPVCGSRMLVPVHAAGKRTERFGPIDIVFPLLHGSFGEDGTLQGLLRLCDVPFVGAGVLGSAVGMDKDFMKRILKEAGIPIPRFSVLRWCDRKDLPSAARGIGLPLFVKPANLGSSVGISMVKDEQELEDAVEKAFGYDTKIVIEEAVRGREIECAVLGNESPVASAPGEIVPSGDFYSYEAKYIDEDGARLIVPADLKEQEAEKVRRLAVESFLVLGCEGMARVDFFLKSDGTVLVNEINTIPGFTDISMYPKLFEETGVPQTELIDRLIRLGLERYEREKTLRRDISQSGG
jgi:D-alanine-D-alanine ligase